MSKKANKTGISRPIALEYLTPCEREKLANPKESCANCKFWQEFDSPHWEEDEELDIHEKLESVSHETNSAYPVYWTGFCLRYPPITRSDDGQHNWPILAYDEWCGEWMAVCQPPPTPAPLV